MKFEIKVEKLVGHDKESKIGKLNVKEGDVVSVGYKICTLESGKGTAVVEAKAGGKITRLLVKEGDMVKKGQTIGEMDADESSIVDSSKDQPASNKASDAVKQKYSFGFAKPKKESIETEILIIGGGPGGYVAALHGAKLGKKVVLVEKEALGGTCLNWGCIPTKSLAHTAHVLENIKDAHEFGIESKGAAININAVIGRKNQVVETLTGGIAFLLENAGVKTVIGEAVAVDSHTVEVKNSKVEMTIKAENIIIATGASPSRIPILGADLEKVVTSREMLDMEVIPKKLVIIGAGVIGMEFAFIMNAFGSDVTVIEYQKDILPMVDQDVIDAITKEAKGKGIKLINGTCVEEIMESSDDQMIIRYNQEGKIGYLTGNLVLMSTGRKANLHAIDLDVLGVELNECKNGIGVLDTMQTNVEHIYAIGDVTNKIQLAHVASHQGMVAIDHISGKDAKMHYDIVPSAIFTTPEIGSVGMTEKEAKDAGIDFRTSLFSFCGNGKALVMGDVNGFVKLIADNETDEIIGGSIVGMQATDMIPAIVHLMQHKIKIEDAMETIYAHPTEAEGIHEALLGLKGMMIHG